MSEYDSTNSGVIFQPHSDQTLSGQGKLNINGTEKRIVMIFEKISRDGKPVQVLYERLGPLFANDKKGNDKAPDLSGPMDNYSDLKMATWKGQKDGRKYMSVKVTPKQAAAGDQGAQQGGSKAAPPADDGWDDDEIPF